jgi:hypothetical protein
VRRFVLLPPAKSGLPELAETAPGSCVLTSTKPPWKQNLFQLCTMPAR